MSNWNVRSGVIAVEIQGIYLLVADREARKHCKYMREINELGAFIWNQMQLQKSYEEIINKIRDEYELPAEFDLEKDVNDFLSDLRRNQYLLDEEKNLQLDSTDEIAEKCQVIDQVEVPLWAEGAADEIGNEQSAQNSSIFETTSLPKKIYNWSHTSFIAPILSPIYMGISALEYAVLQLIWFMQGNRNPSDEDKKLVRDNVTFIFKSFQRQKLAKGLCRSISHMYPNVQIVVADDSKEPLHVDLPNVQVIHLPFNSGLSAGLAAALDEVKTPYVMRLDDDELLTVKTQVHRELRYLMEHPEVDLIGFGHTTAIRLHSPEFNFQEYYRSPMKDGIKPLKIPHMTQLDEWHIVLGKVANIYLARTDKVRQVGFDPSIRIIDHHDFFRRAAGTITSAAATDTVVFHRHNPYNRKYNAYRADYQKDLLYIRNRDRKNRSKENEEKTL